MTLQYFSLRPTVFVYTGKCALVREKEKRKKTWKGYRKRGKPQSVKQRNLWVFQDKVLTSVSPSRPCTRPRKHTRPRTVQMWGSPYWKINYEYTQVGCSDEGGAPWDSPAVYWNTSKGRCENQWRLWRGDPELGVLLTQRTIVVTPPHSLFFSSANCLPYC